MVACLGWGRGGAEYLIVHLPINMRSLSYSQTSYRNDLSVLRFFSFMQAEQFIPLLHENCIFKLIGLWASFIIVLQGYFRRFRSTKPCSDGTRIFVLPVMANARRSHWKSYPGQRERERDCLDDD